MTKIVKLLTATAIAAVGLIGADFIQTSGSKFESIKLYPQTTIGNNDKEATQKMQNVGAMNAQINTVVKGKDLVVTVKWKDSTNSKQTQNSAKLFADSVALQFASDCSDMSKLPYIGMGSDGRSTLVLLQKNTEGVYDVKENTDFTEQQAKQNLNLFGDELKKKEAAQKALTSAKYNKVFVAEGFRSMTEVKNLKGYDMSMSYKKGEWTAVFKKPLNDEYAKSCDATPLAVAIWDGAKDGRNGNKWLSGWVALKLSDSQKAKADIAKLTEKSKGDAQKGKKLATDNCVACHTMGDLKAAMPYMAPDLSNMGGQATIAYLKESIVAPSAAIVPGYNKNAHPTGQWYSLDDKGNRVSTMPAFDYLQPSEIDDILAFLQTLKTEVKK